MYTDVLAQDFITEYFITLLQSSVHLSAVVRTPWTAEEKLHKMWKIYESPREEPHRGQFLAISAKVINLSLILKTIFEWVYCC